MKYLLFISYIGTTFKGVQKQLPTKVNNIIFEHDTVCGSIEKAWDTVLNRKKIDEFRIFSSSRTDSGVHAIRSSVCIWLPEEKVSHKLINTSIVTSYLNKYFLKNDIDIRIIETLHVPENFDVRRSAISRTYLYRFAVELSNESSTLMKIPMSEHNRTFFTRVPQFDVEKVQEATKLFLGEKDHLALIGKPSKIPEEKSTVRTIEELDFRLGKPFVSYDPFSQHFTYFNVICTARSFLYRQVRRMVSLLIAVGQHKVTLDEIQALFDKRDPSLWPTRVVLVPPYGLYLLDVRYKPEDLIRKENVEAVNTKVEAT